MLKRMRFRGPSVVADIREKYGFDGELLDIFASVEGVSVMKWHHYIPIYDAISRASRYRSAIPRDRRRPPVYSTVAGST
jgi:hypothetical protein